MIFIWHFFFNKKIETNAYMGGTIFFNFSTKPSISEACNLIDAALEGHSGMPPAGGMCCPRAADVRERPRTNINEPSVLVF